jgi:hypothetical protein
VVDAMDEKQFIETLDILRTEGKLYITQYMMDDYAQSLTCCVINSIWAENYEKLLLISIEKGCIDMKIGNDDDRYDNSSSSSNNNNISNYYDKNERPLFEYDDGEDPSEDSKKKRYYYYNNDDDDDDYYNATISSTNYTEEQVLAQNYLKKLNEMFNRSAFDNKFTEFHDTNYTTHTINGGYTTKNGEEKEEVVVANEFEELNLIPEAFESTKISLREINKKRKKGKEKKDGGSRITKRRSGEKKKKKEKIKKKEKKKEEEKERKKFIIIISNKIAKIHKELEEKSIIDCIKK